MKKTEEKSSRSAEGLYKFFIYFVLILLAVTIIVPVAWVFMASIKQNSEFYGNPWALPAGFYWQNFVNAWNGAKMGEYMLNSGSGHSTGSGAVAGDCAAGSLLPVSFPVQGPQAAEHAVYGRTIHQCQLYRSSHLPDAA